MLKAFIVDDELPGRNLLCKLLTQYFPGINISGQASNINEALSGIQQHSPDIVFLDIQMKEETGFDLLDRLPEINFALIFTSAFHNYAIKAFRFNAIDYLLKPIVVEELKEAVEKAKHKIENDIRFTSKKQVENLYDDIKNPQKLLDKIAVPAADGFIIVPLQEIIYCQANGNYTEFFLADKRSILSSYTLKQYDEMLSPQSFFRAHRSYLINLAHVKKYKRGEGGEIVMSNGHEIELSRTHKNEFIHLLNIRQ